MSSLMALRYKIGFLALVGLMFCPAKAEAQSLQPKLKIQNCSDMGSDASGLRESGMVLFLAHETAGQGALLPDVGYNSGWLQVTLDGDELSINNQMGGVGLPIDIYNVEILALDHNGREIAGLNTQMDRFASCEPLTMFPGGQSGALKLPFARADLPANARLRIRLWVNKI